MTVTDVRESGEVENCSLIVKLHSIARISSTRCESETGLLASGTDAQAEDFIESPLVTRVVVIVEGRGKDPWSSQTF